MCWLAATGAGSLVVVVVLGGCNKALFPPDAPRSQYQRYDESRDRDVPSVIEDEYGRTRPNIRGRLTGSG